VTTIKNIDLKNYFEDFFQHRNFSQLKNTSSFFDRFPPKRKITSDLSLTKMSAFYSDILIKINSDKLYYKRNPRKLNFWEGIELGEDERKHCSVLYWLLNPRGNHAQGAAFFSIFLKKLGMEELSEKVKNNYFTVTREKYQEEYGRMDITIENKYFHIILEVKIAAQEQREQINRYQSIISHKKFINNLKDENCKLIFLTPEGRSSITGESDPRSFKFLAEVLDDFTANCENSFLQHLIQQYSQVIRKLYKRRKYYGNY